MAAETWFVIAALCIIRVAGAAAQEALLRAAILNPSTRTFTLTQNIFLTADLPVLPARKTFTLIGRHSGTSHPVTVDGQGRYRMFRNVADANLTLQNLVITRAKWSAVDLSYTTRLSANNVTFSNMPSALKLTGAVKAVMRGCKFLRNTNGSVFLEWGPQIAFRNCEFTSNASPHQWGGGAILAMESTTVDIGNSTFTNNSATRGDGGAVAILSEPSGMSISNCTIRNSMFLNNAARQGGAVSVFQGRLIIVGTTFKRNTATESSGGALRLLSSEGPGCFASVASSKFEMNKAPKSFGGAFSLSYLTEIVFCRCSFSGNTGLAGFPSNGYAINTFNKIITTPRALIRRVRRAPRASVAYASGQKCLS